MFASPPEGTTTVTAEGDDIQSAVALAAGKLETKPAGVVWSLDKSWFRNDAGGVVPRDTVRIVAWARDAEELEAADDAQAWLETLLGHMGFEEVKVTARVGHNGAVTLEADVDAGARLVGKRGRTLEAVTFLLQQSIGADYPDRTFRLDVTKKPEDREARGDRDRDRGRGRDRDDRGRGRDRDDRGRGRDRDDRGRGRDRDDRGRGRGRGRGRDRDDRNSKADVKKLTGIAEKIAKRVIETGESEVVRKELNSFERRIIHVAISELDGVATRSIGEGNLKQIEIYADGAGVDTSEADLDTSETDDSTAEE